MKTLIMQEVSRRELAGEHQARPRRHSRNRIHRPGVPTRSRRAKAGAANALAVARAAAACGATDNCGRVAVASSGSCLSFPAHAREPSASDGRSSDARPCRTTERFERVSHWRWARPRGMSFEEPRAASRACRSRVWAYRVGRERQRPARAVRSRVSPRPGRPATLDELLPAARSWAMSRSRRCSRSCSAAVSINAWTKSPAAVGGGDCALFGYSRAPRRACEIACARARPSFARCVGEVRISRC